MHRIRNYPNPRREREPLNGKTWFPTGSILPNKAHVDAAVRELLEEIGLFLTVDDLMLLSSKHVRVPCPSGQHHFVHVFSTLYIFHT
jgi:8-oxo-dGTP pyrophosphatase MutT (NUDIX family)